MKAGRSLKPFHRPWLWSALWVAAIVVVVVMSLLPPRDLPPGSDLVNDKIEHFTAYFALMAAAVQLYAWRASRVTAAVLLVLMGVWIEYMQGAMHLGRSRDPFDVLANTLGVIVGFTTVFTPWRDLLLKIDGGRRAR